MAVACVASVGIEETCVWLLAYGALVTAPSQHCYDSGSAPVQSNSMLLRRLSRLLLSTLHL